jgi:hypothetical protein
MQSIIAITLLVLLTIAPAAHADRQSIAPGTGRQDSTVVNAGLNGVCETQARRDDVQLILVGQGEPNADVIRCGSDGLASSVAAGDDVQRIAPSGDCNGPNDIVIDSGADGVAASVIAGDDIALLELGKGEPEADCVAVGGDGFADTPDPVGGDDEREIALDAAEPNTAVIRCGLNETADTFANNFRNGDDVQLIPVGNGCQGPQSIVVDSGANGIAETRAQGAEIVLSVPAPLEVTIKKNKSLGTRRFRTTVQNLEFENGAPAGRTYRLVARDGSCPNGTVSEIDADARVAGAQETANIPLGKRVKGSVVLAFRPESVTSVTSKLQFRCAIELEAEATDVSPDDASNPANNEATIPVVVVDQNDL